MPCHTLNVSGQVDCIPILALPESIAFLIMHGSWTDIVLRTSWHRDLILKQSKLTVTWFRKPLFASFDWPPASSTSWGDNQEMSRLPERSQVVSSSEMNAAELQLLADQMRRWGSGFLAGLQDGPSKTREELLLRHSILTCEA